MNRPASAIGGGVVGTTLMSLVFVLMEVQTRYAIGIFGAIARFVRTPGRLYLGFLVFAFAGVVVWPLLYVVLEDHLPRGPDPAVRGMVLGACLWVPFVVTARGDIGGPLVLVYVAVSLLAHLVYGFVFGAVYASLADGRRGPASRRQEF